MANDNRNAALAAMGRREPPAYLSSPNVFDMRPDAAAFQAYLQKVNQKEDPTYDMYAAFHDNFQPDARGHFPDTYKTPQHPTFSTESKFSNPQQMGGAWSPGQRPDSWTFKASPFNLQNMSEDQLRDYFDRVEFGNTVRFPGGGSYTGGDRGPVR